MTKLTARSILLSGVSTAIAVLVLPTSAQAQATTCSQTGSTITCVDGATTVLTASTTATTTTVPGPGLVTVDVAGPSTTSYVATGPIATTATPAVVLTSTGGPLSFRPSGTNAPVNISTVGGAGANGVTLNTVGQAATVTVGNIATSGTNSFGVLSNGGTDLTLTTGNITTTGAASRGIQALNNTGTVNIVAGNLTTTDRAISAAAAATSNATVTAGNIVTGASGVLVNGNNVSITTGNVTAANGFGVVGQALGAGTGSVVVKTGAVTSTNGAAVGGTAFNLVGGVDVTCTSATSNSPGAAAVFAQNNGTGALSINCGAVSNVGNNAVFARSFGAPDGGNISITTGSATNSGTSFSTIFAQTNGTGKITVNAGTVTGGASGAGVGAEGITLVGGTGAIDVGYGNVTTVGTALSSNSTGTLNLRGAGSTLKTSGAGATGAILNANGVTGNLGNVTTTAAGSQGAVITSTAPVNLTVGTVSTTGNGLTVNAGANAVTLTTGAVTASEAGATGTVINSTGAVTFNGGKQTANGANALRINGGAGAINATVNGAATTGAGSAVVITGTGPATFANTGTITTTGAASNGINISGVTTATVTCGNVSTTGANSPAVVIAANGTTNVTCGTVSTTGADSNAIVVSNTAGTTTVTAGTTTTTGANSRGVVVSSTGGDVAVTAVNTTTSGANATGVTATATNAKVRVIANNVSVSGLGSGAVRASALGEAFVSVGNALATQANTVEVTSAIGQAAVRIFGTTEARLGSSALVARGATVDIEVLPTGSLLSATGDALVATSSGGGIAIRNTGLISSTGGYSVNADGGPVTLTNSGTLNGRILFGTSADTLNNTGIFNASGTSNFGAGTDALNNNANGRILTSGSATFAGLETLTNAGTISLVGNGIASRLTTNGNYIGAGGQLLLDVNDTTADLLSIGGSATGSTTIGVNRLGTTTFGTSTLLVDAGAGSVAGAFTLAASDRQVGFLTNGVVFDAANNDFRLNSVVGTGVSRTLKFAEAQANLWYQSSDAVTSHLTSARDAVRAGEAGPDFWLVMHGAVDDREETSTAVTNGISQTFANDYKQDYFGGQAGVGFGVGGATVGLTGGYLSSHLSFAGIAEGAEMGAYNVGAYAAFNSGVLFVNALAKYDFYNVDVNSGALGYRADLNGNAYGANVEIGARLGSDGFFVEPVASIAYVRSDLDRISAFSQTIDFDKFDSFRGTAGARIGGLSTMANGNTLTYYLEGRAVHEFKGDDGLLFTAGGNSVRLQNDANGTYGTARGGLQITMPGGVAGFIEGTGKYGGDDFNSYGGRAGLSIKF